MSEREIRLLAQEIVKEQMKYEVVGVEDAAKILGLTPRSIYKKIATIPHGKFGKKLRFFKGDLIKMISR